ncbi:MAG TPA: formate/nitrite transporter family protein [Candidatus Acidoferrales bacterium]|nr:formate/nitrite transporter family protein [Candidatus Acidoferrales bacterium]
MSEKDNKLSSPESPPIVTKEEKKRVKERSAIGANIVYEAIRLEGEEELVRPASALAWSALAAGLSMGFSFIAESLLETYLPDAPWRPLISKFGYSVGFLIVVLGRQQLFTENTLTVILPLLLHKNAVTFLRVLRLWGIVLFFNAAGTLLFAYFCAYVHFFNPQVRGTFYAIGAAHLGAGFGIAFARAIFAGWLIALMVWLLPAAESSRVTVIILLTYLIGLGGFGHIIAGSTTVFYLVALHQLSWPGYFQHFFFPTLLGNIVGGVSLVAALGHAQVVAGKE